MAYNIPGIFTSVTDRSYAQAITLGGRSVLIAGFSKYGDEDFHQFSDIENMKFKLGELNIKKYGLGMFYALGALSRTRNVIFKRLLPDDATYSNLIFKDNGTSITATGASDKDALVSLNSGDDVYAVMTAKARGEGYNNISVKFSAAPLVEREYADAEGDVKYRFNFIKVTVYETSPTGVKTKSDEYTVSLIDTDPNSGVPIIDTLTAQEMFINKKFGKKNDYVDFGINASKIESMKENLNIDELTAAVDAGGNKILGANRVILVDENGKNIEVQADATGKLTYQATVTPGKPKLVLAWSITDNQGTVTTTRKALTMSGGSINIENDFTQDPIHNELFIDGDTSFWKLYINADGLLTTTKKITPRQALFDLLTSNNGGQDIWTLQSGSDGANLTAAGALNMYGAGTAASENAKQLLMNFYDQDSSIREVIYPELDFDYVPDWTGDIDVQNSIVSFADTIGITMPIISFGYATNSDEDYRKRKEELYFSSYNTMIYSGQENTSHYLAETGQTITAPLSYYAMLLHLGIDNTMSITEPVANMSKGALPVSGASLTYIAKSADIAKLRAVQVNTVIKEADGIYLIDQLTAYKNASKLSRGNVVKVIHRMRKDIPKRLKDLLQLKAINDITGRAESRVREYMAQWQASPDNVVDGIFESIEVNSVFISEEFKLIVAVAITPIGTVEQIEVPITVF